MFSFLFSRVFWRWVSYHSLFFFSFVGYYRIFSTYIHALLHITSYKLIYIPNVLKENNIASQIGVTLEGKFVSKNVINLSRRNLSASKISSLSEGLKFVPTANKIEMRN